MGIDKLNDVHDKLVMGIETFQPVYIHDKSNMNNIQPEFPMGIDTSFWTEVFQKRVFPHRINTTSQTSPPQNDMWAQNSTRQSMGFSCLHQPLPGS